MATPIDVVALKFIGREIRRNRVLGPIDCPLVCLMLFLNS